jgi:Bardet-Biedl syndrome 4 protein
MAYYGKSNYLVAISCLKKALYLDPFDYQVNFNLGFINKF